jgi:hypothetical protein
MLLADELADARWPGAFHRDIEVSNQGFKRFELAIIKANLASFLSNPIQIELLSVCYQNAADIFLIQPPMRAYFT